MNPAELLGRLEPYRGEERTLVPHQDTSDIMDGMARWHKKYRHHYDAIAGQFLGRTERETAKNVYEFLKRHVSYIIESDAKQTLKTPAAIIATGHGDCKHYALFTAGILDALATLGLQRTPWAFRFASYKWYDETPQHVFVVLNPGTKREIWVDPVLSRFDQRKPYTHAIDNRMALVGISGVNAPAQVAGLKDLFQKGKQVVLKVYAAPSRAAFLGIVRLNVFGLANKLYTIWQNNPASLKNWWAGLGGEINKLTDVIEAGRKKPRVDPGSVGKSVGIDPGTAAVIAAAAPVMTALIGLFQQNNLDASDIRAAAEYEMNQRAQNAAGWEIAPEVIDDRRADSITNQMQAREGGTNWALIGAAGLAIILLLRK